MLNGSDCRPSAPNVQAELRRCWYLQGRVVSLLQGLLKKLRARKASALTQDEATLASVGLEPSVDALPQSLKAPSDFIKRATCVRCGASKALPSPTAYLYCDYCGALIDYDVRLANAGTNISITNKVWEGLAAPLRQDLEFAKVMGYRDRYRDMMLHVFDQWVTHCPQAVSPRAKTDATFRKRLVAYMVEVTVCKDMDPEQQAMDERRMAILASLTREPVPGGAWKVVGDFWSLAALWKKQMELAYERIEATGISAMNPDNPPPGVALKMEYSCFCQTWLPHLSAADGERLLADFGLQDDYARIAPPPTETHPCGACGTKLHTVVGARAVVCHHCGRTIDVESPSVPCGNCGAPLHFPVGTTRLPCPHCRTKNHRV